MSTTLESLASHRTNEVMKILTIFSVIMVPLSVVSGIHGMNLVQLPLASHPMPFVIITSVMVCFVAVIRAYSRREGRL